MKPRNLLLLIVLVGTLAGVAGCTAAKTPAAPATAAPPTPGATPAPETAAIDYSQREL